MYASVTEFDTASADQALETLRVCAPIDSWARDVVSHRPYGSFDALLTYADTTARDWNPDDVMQAIAGHARLGRKPTGSDASAAHSRREQSSMGEVDTATADRLAALQDQYAERFGHIFLVRAAGRDAAEILRIIEERITRTPAQERATCADELRQIAMLRLRQAFAA